MTKSLFSKVKLKTLQFAINLSRHTLDTAKKKKAKDENISGICACNGKVNINNDDNNLYYFIFFLLRLLIVQIQLENWLPGMTIGACRAR